MATYSVGHEHLDLNALQARGIPVVYTPDVLSATVADDAMLLMLGAARRAREGQALIVEGRWTGWGPRQLIGTEVTGKRLGIFGMGRIGREIARRASAFDMEIGYHNRRPLEPEAGLFFADEAAFLSPHRHSGHCRPRLSRDPALAECGAHRPAAERRARGQYRARQPCR